MDERRTAAAPESTVGSESGPGGTRRAPRVERIPAQRHGAILEHLRAVRAASVQELAEALGASASTVRRDLDHLAAVGYVARTHGGATLAAAAREVETAVSSHIARAEKAAIGRLAARRIAPHATVIFDSGTTVLEAARAVAGSAPPMTAVTNDLVIAQILGGCPEVTVIVPGGTLRPGSPTLLGAPGLAFLAQLHVDLALIGTHAVTGTLLSDTTLEVAEVKRAMISAAAQLVVLADASKFGPPASFGFCELGAGAELVTDAGAPTTARAGLEAAGVHVGVAAG